MKIGKKIANLRNKKGLTQDQMADVLGVKRARYNSWENDIAKPDIEMLKQIAAFHKVSTDYILETPNIQLQDIPDLKSILESDEITYNGRTLSNEDVLKIQRVLEAIITD